MDDEDQSVELNLMKKNFAMVNTQLTHLKEAADGSDMSDTAEYKEDSHLRLHFVQVEQKFEPRIATILNQSASHEIKLDLTQVILLDNQSTY